MMVVMNFRALKELLQFITDNLEIVLWVRTLKELLQFITDNPEIVLWVTNYVYMEKQILSILLYLHSCCDLHKKITPCMYFSGYNER
jgi:hypothetical protein